MPGFLVVGIIVVSQLFTLGAFGQSQSLRTEGLQNNHFPHYTTYWSIGIKGSNTQDDLSNQKTMFGSQLKLDFKAHFTPEAYVQIRPIIALQTGFTQTQEASQSQASRIEMLHGAFHYQLTDALQMSIGVHDQNTFQPDLLIDEKGFPGFRSEFKYSGSWQNRFYLEAAIPPATSLSNNSMDLDKTPILTSLGMLFSNKKNNLSNHYTFGMSYFHFQNLPTQIANGSLILGNSGDPINSTDSSFKYAYQGLTAQANLSIVATTSSALLAEAKLIRNAAAPEGSNSGFSGTLGLQYQASAKLSLTPKITFFKMEEDAAVAIYNDWLINTNRLGYIASVKFNFNRVFSLSLQFGQRDAIIEKNTTQPREQIFYFSVESENAKI